jgi:hypothetical protein
MEKKHNEIEVLIEDFNNLNFAKLLQLWFNEFWDCIDMFR